MFFSSLSTVGYFKYKLQSAKPETENTVGRGHPLMSFFNKLIKVPDIKGRKLQQIHQKTAGLGLTPRVHLIQGSVKETVL